MTDAEKILWRSLRNRKQNNTKFRRQVPFALGEYHFVADFYCPEKKLIIEIDGSIHRENDIIEYNRFREDIFKIGSSPKELVKKITYKSCIEEMISIQP